jgi:hypothetical protein
MITVIIPALNEEKSIGHVVKLAGNFAIGFSFCSCNDTLDPVADFVIRNADFNLLILIIQ